MNRTERTLWRALLALIGAALLGSLWAAFFREGCASCGGSTASAGGQALAKAGVLYYLLLLGAAFRLGPSLLVWRGVLLAAGIHAALLVVLLTRGAPCLPCLVTGAGAIGAAVLSCCFEPCNLARASIVFPAAALVTQVTVLALGMFPGLETSGTKSSPPVARAFTPGMAKILIYERSDCIYCRRLRDEVLPGLTKEFGRRLEVEHRSADDLPGLPTPTIILMGAGGRRSFPGLPDADALRQAILETLGDRHDRQALLPASR
jgi:hypothetical protein